MLFWVFQQANTSLSVHWINAGPDSRIQYYWKAFTTLQNVANVLEGTKYGCGTVAFRFMFYGPSQR